MLVPFTFHHIIKDLTVQIFQGSLKYIMTNKDIFHPISHVYLFMNEFTKDSHDFIIINLTTNS